jgi:hypothetical protein
MRAYRSIPEAEGYAEDEGVSFGEEHQRGRGSSAGYRNDDPAGSYRKFPKAGNSVENEISPWATESGYLVGEEHQRRRGTYR